MKKQTTGHHNTIDSVASRERMLPLQEDFFTVPLEPNLALRVCADSRPHNLKTTQLQKGLILILNGKELIEEGTGFGVPVGIYSDDTYFSSSAQVLIDRDGQNKVIVKRFLMDTISKKNWKIEAFVQNPLYKSIEKRVGRFYRDHPVSQKLILSLNTLNKKMGIKSSFVKTESRGEVIITYRIKNNDIKVEVNLTKLNKRRLDRVAILNEQGSTFFRRFADSNGSNSIDHEINAWNLVKAEWACLSDLDNTLGFCLKNLPNSKMFVGREYFMEELLAWAGIEYEVISNLDIFNYEIKICMEKDV